MKFLYYAYWKIYNWSISISDDFLNDIKPLILMMVLEAWTFLNSVSWICYFFNTRLNLSKIMTIGVFGLMAIINYRIFLYKNKWKQYSHEFQHYSKGKKTLWNMLIIFIFIFMLSFSVFSFWMLKKVGYIPPYHAKNDSL